MSLASREIGVIRRMMREGRYVLTHHALDELIADDLHVQDIGNRLPPPPKFAEDVRSDGYGTKLG
jgi:hypothetical protein